MRNRIIASALALLLMFILAPKSVISVAEIIINQPKISNKQELLLSGKSNIQTKFESVCKEEIGNATSTTGKCTCTGNVECKKSPNSISCKTKANGSCWEKYCMLIPNGSCRCVNARLGADCSSGGPPISNSVLRETQPLNNLQIL